MTTPKTLITYTLTLLSDGCILSNTSVDKSVDKNLVRCLVVGALEIMKIKAVKEDIMASDETLDAVDKLNAAKENGK